jgi:hypothetical protein
VSHTIPAPSSPLATSNFPPEASRIAFERLRVAFEGSTSAMRTATRCRVCGKDSLWVIRCGDPRIFTLLAGTGTSGRLAPYPRSVPGPRGSHTRVCRAPGEILLPPSDGIPGSGGSDTGLRGKCRVGQWPGNVVMPAWPACQRVSRLSEASGVKLRCRLKINGNVPSGFFRCNGALSIRILCVWRTPGAG